MIQSKLCRDYTLGSSHYESTQSIGVFDTLLLCTLDIILDALFADYSSITDILYLTTVCVAPLIKGKGLPPIIRPLYKLRDSVNRLISFSL